MATVKELIDELGGTVKVATDLTLPNSTVSSWNRSNSIPDWRWDAVKKLAKRRRVDISKYLGASGVAA